MDKQIVIDGLKFERGEDEGGLHYEYTDLDTGITWTVFRPQCPDFCTPFWTCTVTQGKRIQSLTMFASCTDGTAGVGPLYYDVPHGTEDPPMQLLAGVTDMIHQGVDPFGPGTEPQSTAPQTLCPVESGAQVIWSRRAWKVTGREWRGRWLLTLTWPRNGGQVYDVPAHQVALVQQSVEQQLRLM